MQVVCSGCEGGTRRAVRCRRAEVASLARVARPSVEGRGAPPPPLRTLVGAAARAAESPFVLARGAATVEEILQAATRRDD